MASSNRQEYASAPSGGSRLASTLRARSRDIREDPSILIAELDTDTAGSPPWSRSPR
jgi:hypothetical protein